MKQINIYISEKLKLNQNTGYTVFDQYNIGDKILLLTIIPGKIFTKTYEDEYCCLLDAVEINNIKENKKKGNGTIYFDYLTFFTHVKNAPTQERTIELNNGKPFIIIENQMLLEILLSKEESLNFFNKIKDNKISIETFLTKKDLDNTNENFADIFNKEMFVGEYTNNYTDLIPLRKETINQIIEKIK